MMNLNVTLLYLYLLKRSLFLIKTKLFFLLATNKSLIKKILQLIIKNIVKVVLLGIIIVIRKVINMAYYIVTGINLHTLEPMENKNGIKWVNDIATTDLL